MIGFTVYGQPQPAGSKRALRNQHTGRTHVVDANKNAKPWQAAVASAGAHAMGGLPLFSGPLRVSFQFYRPRPQSHYGTGRNASTVRPAASGWPTSRPDVLKLARGVEDALTGVCWRDDAQIVSETLTKFYGEPARVYVEIKELAA